jgi:hypothetical protein
MAKGFSADDLAQRTKKSAAHAIETTDSVRDALDRHSRVERAMKIEAGELPAVTPPQPLRLPLEAIKNRVNNDLRPVVEERALTFARSIAMVGLIQPMAVDTNDHLLAGDTRRRALTILKEASGKSTTELQATFPDAAPEELQQLSAAWLTHGFDRGVPVHRMNIDSRMDPKAARDIETMENTQRHGFTKEEFRAVYRAYKDAGYKTTAGRPKKGERSIRPELVIVFGLSERHITTLIADVEREDAGQLPAPPADPVPPTPTLQRVLTNYPAVKVKRAKTGKQVMTVAFDAEGDLSDVLAGIIETLKGQA